MHSLVEKEDDGQWSEKKAGYSVDLAAKTHTSPQPELSHTMKIDVYAPYFGRFGDFQM